MNKHILVDMTKRKTKFDISFNRCINFGALITDTSRVHANPANQCSYCCFPSRKTTANQVFALFGKAEIVILYVAG